MLTPAEVAAKFRVDPKTVTRWAKAGRISSIRTLGGHRRYPESEVTMLLQEGMQGRGEVAQALGDVAPAPATAGVDDADGLNDAEDGSGLVGV